MRSIIRTNLVYCFILAISFQSSVIAQGNNPMIGEEAPPFSLVGIDGKTYSLEDQRGNYVVIHIAATWCPFCNAEAPNLEKLHKKYKDKGVKVFIIDVKESKEQVANAFSRFNFTFPVLLDEDGSISASYAPEGVLPDLARDEVPLASNLIIDREGKIVFYSLLDTATFDAKLTKVLEKLEILVGSN